MDKPILYCAVYTRKSSEEGLQQEFNSLHAQREACESYIASQKHEGWHLVKTHYDDGGFSGGNIERPALKQLLEDIENKKINVVVVYKVDRLTRSLTDFARIIERFDKHNVSFVSVTQQFNTTSSMGRLTLNVLLSFAQFEREVTSERIRDKIAASKKKGIWMGGFVPLGYDLMDRKLLINVKEAKTVQLIYNKYLELKCVRLLKEDLDREGIYSKNHKQKGNCSFSRGALYKILSNPIYLGKIHHKGTYYPGQHQAIIDQELWEKVQKQMADNSIEHRTYNKSLCPLVNKLFDVSGERLVTAHANKKGRRYKYYIAESLRANPKDASSSGWRLPGQEIEQIIAHAAAEILQDDVAIAETLKKAGIAPYQIQYTLNKLKNLQQQQQQNTADLINRFIQKVELSQDGINVTLSLTSFTSSSDLTIVRNIPLRMKRRGIETRLIINGGGPARIDQTLLKTVVCAYKWFNDLITGKMKNMAEIALNEGVDKSYVSRVVNLAFLAPDITESIIAGQQPVDLTTEKLTKRINLPLDWAQQRQLLGFT